MRDSITARAAEAAWRATIPAVDDKGIGWDEMASHTRNVFRTMARAVIDALGLTEEWNVQTDGRPHLEADGRSAIRRDARTASGNQ